MAIQRFEHITAPEGTIDAMRELVEGVEALLAECRRRAKATGQYAAAATERQHFAMALNWSQRRAVWDQVADELEALLKARAALEGEEGEKG